MQNMVAVLLRAWAGPIASLSPHWFSPFYRAMLAQSAVLRLLSSVCPSVTFRYQEHIGWNSSEIILWPNSLRPLLWLTPNMGDRFMDVSPL